MALQINHSWQARCDKAVERALEQDLTICKESATVHNFSDELVQV